MPFCTVEQQLPYWEHQEREHVEHKDDRARALLWSMRTGKTRACIRLAEYLWGEGRIEAVIVIAPNGVHDNWVLRELPKYSPGGLHRALAWCYPERDFLWFQKQLHEITQGAPACYLDWLCINSESIQFKETRQAIGRFIWKHRKVKRKFLLIVDESSDFGNPGAGRTPFVIALGPHAVAVRILDGTVVEDSPLKSWSQYQILKRGALGYEKYSAFQRHFAEFEDDYGKGGRKYQKLIGYRNLPELRAAMAKWSSVVLREDCKDMPALLRVVRSYRPSPEQLEAYEAMRLEFEMSTDRDVVITALEAGTRIIKLQQILSGYILDKEGNIHDIPGRNPRHDLLVNEVSFDPGKVIVWCRFRPDVFKVAARLRKEGIGVVQYVGGMSRADKNKSVDRFQKDKGITAFVGTPVRGLELSEADTVIWFSHTFWTLMRSQADERATKVGGSATTAIDFVAQTLVGGGVDEYVLDNQAGKKSIADDLSRGGLKKVLQELKL